MEQAHQLASEKVTMKFTKRKRQFDKKARAIPLKAGDIGYRISEKSARN